MYVYIRDQQTTYIVLNVLFLGGDLKLCNSWQKRAHYLFGDKCFYFLLSLCLELIIFALQMT